MTASKYNRGFTWMQRSTVKDATTGQDQEVFTPNGLLFGSLETDSSSEAVEYGSLQAQADATITLRQWPQVSALDRLIDRQFGQTWVLTGVRIDYPRNETVCRATVFQSELEVT